MTWANMDCFANKPKFMPVSSFYQSTLENIHKPRSEHLSHFGGGRKEKTSSQMAVCCNSAAKKISQQIPADISCHHF